MVMAPEQLAELVTQHAPALTLYARQWCHCAEDVVQSAFLKLAAMPTPPNQVVPYLYRMVRNLAIDMARANRRRKKHEMMAATQSFAWFEPDDDPGGLDASHAARALCDIPADCREVIIAHLWGGLTFEQIGIVQGSSAATCHRRFMAGITALRERLKLSHPLTGPLSPR